MFQAYKRLVNDQLLPWLVVLCAFAVPLKTGVFGLLFFLNLLYAPLKISNQVSSRYDGVALQGLVIAMAFGCLFNSLLMDAGEGRFFTLMLAVLSAGLGNCSSLERSK